MQEAWVQSLGREDPLEKGVATHPVFLPVEFHGQRSLVNEFILVHVSLFTLNTFHGYPVLKDSFIDSCLVGGR